MLSQSNASIPLYRFSFSFSYFIPGLNGGLPILSPRSASNSMDNVIAIESSCQIKESLTCAGLWLLNSAYPPSSIATRVFTFYSLFKN